MHAAGNVYETMNVQFITEDPVRIFDHEPPPSHSVLKLFIDLFSNDTTAALFYTNDVKVLIDIILRQLFDMFPGEKLVGSYDKIYCKNNIIFGTNV